ncbi:probable G-protein coupled receptor 139 [Chiloscyllium plagiosum]|uniref:probable G-protein coupled receptor 139 n=1 Tax=Chiloscyllium plagiosum TaxID=36176 RepID=UPI001CB8123D|nr:probable G-protein coupled receptor 139 [Chiloscyllium plagiosum]
MHAPANGPVFAICYPILAAIGAPANVVAIIILSRGRCGLSCCITYYLVAIAVTDFLVIINGCILNRIGRIYFRDSLLSTTLACKLSTMLIFTIRDGSVWLTVAFTFDRFVAICFQSLKIRYCTHKTASMVIGIVCILSCIKNTPFYFIFRPLYTLKGVPWFCIIKSSYYISPIWQTYDWLDHILVPFLPFLLILLLNAITVTNILAASRARKRIRSAENRSDQEISNRKKSIVLLFAISLSFLFLWATYVGRFLYVQISGEGYFGGLDFNDPQYILQETTIMLQMINSCNNVFIYTIAQNKFREELKNTLMSPFTIFTSCIKQ